MFRIASALTLATALVVACSQPNTQKSATDEGKAQGPPPSAAAQPSAAPETPSPSPSSAPTGELAPQAPEPAQAPPSAPAPAASAPPRQAPRPSPKVEPKPEPPPPPPEPPKPQFREMTIPAGTSLSITLLSTVASNASQAEQPVKGTLAKPLVVDDMTVVPSGAQISGTVIEAKESGRVKGKASVTFQFDRLVVRGEEYRIQTANVKQEAEADTKKDVKRGGIGAGVGAITGGLIGGGTGAAVGAVAGGAGAVLGTKGQEVELQPGAVVTALLQEPLTVTVPVKK